MENKINELRQNINKRYDLYKVGGSRFRRLLKDPFRTSIFYILVLISYIRPFKINTKTLWNDKISFYLPEGNMIYYYGFYEINLINFMVNFIKKDMTIIDIGANVGLYSLLSAFLVGENGKVYSFEPTPRTFKTLKDNCGKYKNIIPIQNALFEDKRKINFIDYGPRYSFLNTINGRLGDNLKFLKKYATNFDLNTVVFDEFVKENNINNISFIKIDVEGVEFNVLKGMKDTLINQRPFITIEVGGGEEWSENNKNSIKFLEENNYIAYEIDILGKIKKHKVQDRYLYDNLLFVPKEKINLVSNLMN